MRFDIVRRIQSWSSGDADTVRTYGFWATHHRSIPKWEEFIVVTADPSQPSGADMYFTPIVFISPRRSNETATGFGCLFADLDEVDPRELHLEPTIAWSTSPDRFQAVWQLERPMERYSSWAELNQRLTYHIGADRGGWMGSKVLRVPETLNWKRAGESPEGFFVPRGVVLWDKSENLKYSAQELDQYVPSMRAIEMNAGTQVTDLLYPTPPSESEWRFMIRSTWKDLPAFVQSALLTQPRDRSWLITKTIHAMLEARHTPDFTFEVVHGAPWNKFANRPATLWAEVMKAKAKQQG